MVLICPVGPDPTENDLFKIVNEILVKWCISKSVLTKVFFLNHFKNHHFKSLHQKYDNTYHIMKHLPKHLRKMFHLQGFPSLVWMRRFRYNIVFLYRNIIYIEHITIYSLLIVPPKFPVTCPLKTWLNTSIIDTSTKD